MSPKELTTLILAASVIVQGVLIWNLCALNRRTAHQPKAEPPSPHAPILSPDTQKRSTK